MANKRVLSASVDAEVLKAAENAVRDGSAANVSAWVNEAMRRKMEHDARLRALDEFIAEYEREHGAFDEQEIRDAGRRMRARAIVVRDTGVARAKRAAAPGRRAPKRAGR